MIDPIKHSEHLRLVHFTLVVMCIALFAASLPSKSKKIERALDQLQQITILQSKLMEQKRLQISSNEYIMEAIEKARSKDDPRNLDLSISPPQSGKLLEIELPGDVERKVSILPPPLWHNVYVEKDHPWTPNSDARDKLESGNFFLQSTSQGFGHAGQIPSLGSNFDLEDFRRFWDKIERLNTVFVLKRIYPYAYIEENDCRTDLGEWVSIEVVNKQRLTGLSGSLQVLSSRGNIRESWPTRTHKASYMHQLYLFIDDEDGFRDKHSIAIPVRYYQLDANVQATVADLFEKRPVLGKFERSFAALKEVTEHTESLPLDKLRKQLASEQARNKEAFEIFGVKIPIELISTWGVFSLLSIQLYFWIHLHCFYHQRAVFKNDKIELQTPWIALYPETSAKVVFLFSSIVMPLAVVGYVSFKAWEAYSDIMRELLYLMLFNAACITICAATLSVTIKLWRILDLDPDQHDAHGIVNPDKNSKNQWPE